MSKQAITDIWTAEDQAIVDDLREIFTLMRKVEDAVNSKDVDGGREEEDLFSAIGIVGVTEIEQQFIWGLIRSGYGINGLRARFRIIEKEFIECKEFKRVEEQAQIDDLL